MAFGSVATMGRMTNDPACIRFEAVVSKVQTLADGGVRVVLDLREDSIPQMAMLAQTKVDGIVLEVEVRARAD
jgi:hypothetical protein